jgi:hypothetical protein
MKTILRPLQVWTLLLVGACQGRAQSGFSSELYMKFLEAHQETTAQQLLEDHPFQTLYYEDRQVPADLSVVSWFDSIDNCFMLTPDEKRLLGQNHFMVSERMKRFDWASAFISVYNNDLPLFISSDFVLGTLHQSYDVILETVEWQYLEPNLLSLLQSMYVQFPSLVEKYGEDGRFEVILKDVDLYVTVALSLLEGKERPPQYDTPEKFNEVMAAIDAEQMSYMTLFTEKRLRKIDFSQFTPRGHYNKEIYTRDGVVTLENYFRAMMWLGRIDFLLTAPPENPWEPDWTKDELRRMQLGALLLNELLYGCGKSENLARHEEIISFLVGPDDNLTPEELRELEESMLAGPEALFDESVYLQFSQALNGTDDYGQKIMSNFFYVDPFSVDPGQLPVSFRLSGQKFLLDSYVFSEVVFDRIVHQGEKVWRPLPDPLDVMAALGSEDALALLEGEMEQYHYASNMAGLDYLIHAYDESFWEQSLYNRWLGAIRSLNPPESAAGLPYFMQTTAWHQEKLNTQLAAWAQLRHDNILYGKQSYTGGTSCSYPYTYIEPCPELYERIGSLASEASGFFSRVLVEQVEAREAIIHFYERYAEIMEVFRNIATKEIGRVPLNEQEVTFLKTMINGYMASGPSINGWYNEFYFDPGRSLLWDFTVADVHTQPTDYAGAVVGNVLHVGNGLINMGVFLAENPCNPGQLMAFTGPVSTFRQRVTTQFRRLTDQEWEEGLLYGEDTASVRPDWVWTYLLDGQGTSHPEGRSLKGAVYEGTGTDAFLHDRPFDYLLLFPNPARVETNLRFVLKEKNVFRLEVFDAAGRKIRVEGPVPLLPAEHNVVLPVREWGPGLYLVRIGIGKECEVRQLLVQ